MNELMVHVERVVRPIRATQRRKLRMRRELLGHLREALGEERDRVANDERGAIERATARLGDPGELTATLQETVPAIERLLLARLPMSPRLTRVEQRMARIPGQCGPMTLGHKSALLAIATLACVPLLLCVYRASTTPGLQPTFQVSVLLGSLVGWPALLFASYAFVFRAADPGVSRDWRGTLRRGAGMLALQLALAAYFAIAVANRTPTRDEILMNIAATATVLTISTLVGRKVGVLRRPYDDWLALDVPA